MAELTNNEVQLINQLRSRMGTILDNEEQLSESYLVRWIRARNENLDAAEKMLRENLRWRQEHGLSCVLDKKFPLHLHEISPYHFAGRDKEGRPIIEVLYGKWDIKRIILTFGQDVYFQYTNQMLESILRKCVEEVNRGSLKGSQALFLLDLDGFSYSQLLHVKSMQSVLKVASNYEAYFPEILWRAVLINAPGVFSIMYSMVKPLLPVNSVEKISIYGSDQAVWGPVVDALVDKDQVGPNFGGTGKREIFQ